MRKARLAAIFITLCHLIQSSSFSIDFGHVHAEGVGMLLILLWRWFGG